MQTKSNRVILIVLDSVGIGYLPDAHLYVKALILTVSEIILTSTGAILFSFGG